MASRSGILLLALVVLTHGCGLDCGTKTDESTGLSTRALGLACAGAAVSIDGVKIESNEIPMGKKIVLRFEGVTGFREQKGSVFPGVSMTVTDPEGNTIGKFDDLLVRYDAAGMAPKKAGRISATLATGKPMKTRAEYTWKVRVWDKKGKGEIVSEMKIKMI